jgi:hypothetical protein
MLRPVVTVFIRRENVLCWAGLRRSGNASSKTHIGQEIGRPLFAGVEAGHPDGTFLLTPEKITDGFKGIGPARRESAWAIRSLRDEVLPLFAAVDDRDNLLRPDIIEPRLHLRQ